MILARLAVASVTRPAPSFARVEFCGPDLDQVGVDGPLYDQRIKLLFPGPAGLPDLDPQNWWNDFLALPEESRGSVRTYTIAELTGEGEKARLTVDFVLHPGAHGPGSGWALEAAEGDELLAVLPQRGVAGGGIEFAPGEASRIMLVGDETALPAIVQILRDLPAGRRCTVFVEVPLEADVLSDVERDDVTITWLARNGAAVGDLAVEAVAAYLGFEATAVDMDELEIDPDLWETPVHSSSGEPLASDPGLGDGQPGNSGQPGHSGHSGEDRYAWIAGESSMVTRLRRHLVGEVGVPRSQVAFMGYWREGVAMRG